MPHNFKALKKHEDNCLLAFLYLFVVNKSFSFLELSDYSSILFHSVQASERLAGPNQKTPELGLWESVFFFKAPQIIPMLHLMHSSELQELSLWRHVYFEKPSSHPTS